MSKITVRIIKHPANPGRPAEYSRDVEPHAAEPPRQAGRSAWAGWNRVEAQHQRHHRKLIRAAEPKTPATFQFEGHVRPAEMEAIARAIVAEYSIEVEAYPDVATVEI